MMKLRPYQTKWLRRVYAASGRVLIVGPTGAGKTVVAAAVIRKAHKEGKRVLFLAHRRDLVNQCVTRLHAAGINRVGVIMAGQPMDPDASVQVASIQTYTRREAQAFDVVFIDEAHHATAASYRKVIDDNPDAQLYGMTATPIRLDGKPLSDLFDSIAQSEFAPALIEQGALAKVRVWSHPAPDLSGVKRVGGDYDRTELGKRVKRKSIGDVIDHWVKFAECRPAVCFAVNVEHAKRVAAAFRRRGYTAGLVVAETPIEERARVIAGLSTSETNVVVTVEVLTEGWDCPDAACCIMLRPTMSETLCRQMMGRAMRPTPKWPYSVILDHVGNTTRRQPISPSDARDWADALEPREVRSGNGETRLKECPECKSSVWLGARTCAFCNHVFWQHEPPEEVTGWLSEVTRDVRAWAIEQVIGGVTKPEVASRLGIHVSTVKKWCRDAGLPSKSAYFRKSDTVRLRAIEIMRSGGTMSYARKITGVSKCTISRWHGEAGLNVERRDMDLVRSAVAEVVGGSSTIAVAKTYGVNPGTIGKWCHELGIAPNNPRHRTLNTKTEALTLIADGASTHHVAEVQRVDKTTVQKWCHRAGFVFEGYGRGGRWIPPKDWKPE